MRESSRNVHFVGSVKLDDCIEVFTALSQTVGGLAARYPDGETSERSEWIRWQSGVFAAHPDLERDPRSVNVDPRAGAQPAPKFRARDGVKDVTFDSLGYADEALASYAEFARLQAADVVPGGVRFQVSLPTPLAVVSAFVTSECAQLVERAYERAMQAELETIVAGVPHDQLAIQWDVAIEITAYDGGRNLYESDPLGHVTAAVARMMGMTPEAVQTGVHLCYGDAGHQHIIEPTDLGTSVLFANALSAAAPRPLSWIHMAVPRERNDDEYFAPLTGLDIGETELVLGLIHFTDGLTGATERISAATNFAADFGVATECGFGRRPPDTIPSLLALHADVARA